MKPGSWSKLAMAVVGTAYLGEYLFNSLRVQPFIKDEQLHKKCKVGEYWQGGVHYGVYECRNGKGELMKWEEVEDD